MKISEVDKNVVMQAKFWTDFLEFINNIQNTIDHISDSRWDSPGKRLIDEGLHKLRQGVYNEMERALARCFMVRGIYQGEADEYSRKVAKKVFAKVDPRWLDEWFRMPSCWKQDDIEELKKDIDK